MIGAFVMNPIYPSSGWLYPSDCSSNLKYWGFMVNIPPIHEGPVETQCLSVCSKCNCFRVNKNGGCPICNPALVNDTGDKMQMGSTVAIGKKPNPKPKRIVIALDLSIIDALLSQIISILVADEFQKSFGESKFLLVFLGICPVYVKMKNEIISLSVGELFNDFSAAEFTASSLATVLIEAFQIARMMITTSKDKYATRDLLNQLTSCDVSDLFLFHSTELPSIERDLPYGVHSIEVHAGVVPDHDSVSICVKQGWTHCCIGQCTPDVISYMHNLVFTSTGKVKLRIRVSSSMELVWISGPRTERQLQGHQVDLDVQHLSRDAGFMVTTIPTSKYKSVDCVSVQVYCDYDGYGIITTNTWKKVKTVDDYMISWNVLDVCAMYMKQHSVHALMKSKSRPLERRLSWEITGSADSTSQVGFVHTLTLLFKGLILDDASPVPGHIRREVMFQVMTHGHSYNSFSATTIMLLRFPHSVIYIPPFILVPLVNDIDIMLPKERQSEVMTSVVHISRELFEAIEEQIKSILG